MISCEFFETAKNTIFTDHLGTPASVFIEHICPITKLCVDLPKWLFHPFETIINVEMYTCEIKIR